MRWDDRVVRGLGFNQGVLLMVVWCGVAVAALMDCGCGQHLCMVLLAGPKWPKPEAIVLISTCFQQQYAD